MAKKIVGVKPNFLLRLFLAFAMFLCATPAVSIAQTADSKPSTTLIVPAALLFLVGLFAGIAGAYYFIKRRRASEPVSYGVDERKIFVATVKISTAIGAFVILGVVAIAIVSFGFGTTMQSFALGLGADLLVGAAAASVGAVFGFIFGVPRTMNPADRAAVATAAVQGNAVASTAVLAANTNLERISDWLTTLLIGATLVQIKDLPGWFAGLGTYLGSGGAITNDKIIPFVVVYYFALGFLGIYLITRLYLTTALTQTLGLLTGGQGVSELAALQSKLTAAKASSDPEELLSALSFYQGWPLDDQQRNDAKLNANLARVLAKYLSTGKADDATARLGQLRNALQIAAADPAMKSNLRQDFETKILNTGDATKDAELAKIVQ